MNPVLLFGAGAAALSVVATVIALFLLGRVRDRSAPDSWDALFSRRPASPEAPPSSASRDPGHQSGRRAG
jgi:hypothetical protein